MFVRPQHFVFAISQTACKGALPPLTPREPTKKGSGVMPRIGKYSSLSNEPQPSKKGKSGSEKRERQPHIDFRVTETEKKEIADKAKAAGLDVGAYCRGLCLGDSKIRARRRPSVEAELLARLLGELGKIGSNINQIAHKLNMDAPVNPQDINLALIELRTINLAIIHAAGKKVQK